MDFKTAYDNTRNAISEHSPEICTGLAVIGVISSVVMAVKATPIAMRIIDDEKNYRRKEALRNNKDREKAAELKPVDYIKLCWRPYLGAALMTSTTIGFTVMSNAISSKRNGALMTAYGLCQETLREYQHKVVEEIGAKKEQAIRDDLNKRKVKGDYQGPFNPDNTIGEQRFYDAFSQQWFVSTKVKVDTAINEINAQINRENYATLADFYSKFPGLKVPKYANAIGWKTGEQIDLDRVYTTDITDETSKWPGTAYIIVNIVDERKIAALGSPERIYD